MKLDLNESLTYGDVLIKPQFSFVRSRKDVITSQNIFGLNLKLPIISSNMDSVTESEMASAMALNGGIGALHRFNSIEDNIEEFTNSIDMTVNHKYYTNDMPSKPFVSIGVGKAELNRALALHEVGATHFIIDVAHGAAIHVVEQYDNLRAKLGNDVCIIVGNFDNAKSIETFNYHSTQSKKPDGFKCLIGPGSACLTRVVTGCGGGSVTSLIDCSSSGYPIIADGGIRSSGDLAKAIIAGADLVMCGRLLAGCEESPNPPCLTESRLVYPYAQETFANFKNRLKLNVDEVMLADEHTMLNSTSIIIYKKTTKSYKGSASKASYEVQGKESDWRTPEGDEMLVPYTGPVKKTLLQLEAGLRSSMSYVGANNLKEFKENGILVKCSHNSMLESQAHGKKDTA